MKIEITDKLYSDILEYCKVNNIPDVDKFIKKIVNQGFTTEKWGVIGENKEVKKEIIEKIIISAITTDPEIKIIEKIIVSAITNEETKIIYTGDNKNVVNVIYNVNVKPTKEPKINTTNQNKDNIDLYGERNIRKV
jgi:hypothetical protein